jgi:uncharacterized protein YrrD
LLRDLSFQFNEKESLMTHNGSVGTQLVPVEIHDIRGTTVRGEDNNTLGEVIDVIVDHDTMEIRYLVVDSQGWLDAESFLLPADRISADEEDDNNLVANVSRQQIENSPQYRDHAKQSEDAWKQYEQQFNSTGMKSR